MIVLDVHLNNFYAFKNFHLNFTYPKKIVDSSIENEHLPNRTNFRYKKVNIFFGANASGKTTFGRILMKIFNFIDKTSYNHITSVICDQSQEASFTIDLASSNNVFYRVICVISPCSNEKYTSENIKLEVRKTQILSKDNYESCAKRVSDNSFNPSKNYIEELEKIEELAWLFEYPDDGKQIIKLPNKNRKFRAELRIEKSKKQWYI